MKRRTPRNRRWLDFAKKYLENEENFLIMNADILTDLDINALIIFIFLIKILLH